MTLFDQLQNQKTTELTKATGDGFQVGDVLYSSGGYDQTNVSMFQVTKRTAKTVTFVKLGTKLTDDGYVLPTDKPYGVSYQEPITYKNRRLTAGWKGEFSVRVNDWTNAYPWDGTPQYQTPVGLGH